MIKGKPARQFGKFRRGNGVGFIALFFMLMMMVSTIVLVNSIMVYQQSLITQTAVDSMADGAALKDYLDKAEYSDAYNNILYMADLIKKHLGIEVKNITSDSDAYSERRVVVKGSTDYHNSLPYGNEFSVSVNRDAATEFAKRSYGEEMLSFMESVAMNDIHGYSMASRDLRNGNSTDCSGLVYFAALCCGYPVGPDMFYSGNISERLQAIGFERIPITQFSSISDFLPGDILYYSAADYGTDFGHVETVYSTDPQNILTVGAHGTHGNPESGDQSGNEISIRPATFSDLRYGRYVAVLRPTAIANQLRNPNKNTWPKILAQTNPGF